MIFPTFSSFPGEPNLAAPGAQLGRGGLPRPGGRGGQGPTRERGGADGAAGEVRRSTDLGGWVVVDGFVGDSTSRLI